MTAFPKPSRTASKKRKCDQRMSRSLVEQKNKRSARARDKFKCRFPWCGCARIKLSIDARLEVSHDVHKGMGGNPSGDRSTTAGLITLCRHRHQDGRVSRHKGTLRTRYLTHRGNDGPVAWEVDLDAFSEPSMGARWFEVAREKAVQTLEPLTQQQEHVLRALAEMDC